MSDCWHCSNELSKVAATYCSSCAGNAWMERGDVPRVVRAACAVADYLSGFGDCMGERETEIVAAVAELRSAYNVQGITA